MTALSQSAWAAALAVRETEFGEILRRARLSPHGTASAPTGPGWTIPDVLQNLELGSDPALQRTLAAVVGTRVLNQQIPAEGREWVNWVARGVQALQRIASNCWTDTPTEVRQLFLDFDEVLPPGARGEIAYLRWDQADRPALKFAGLDSRPVRSALRQLYSQVQTSGSATRARDAAKMLRRRGDLFDSMAAVRVRLQSGVRDARPGETLGQAYKRARRTVETAYDDLPEVRGIVSALRAHHRCVTRIMWVLLGAAEQLLPAVVTSVDGSMAESVVDGERHLDITVPDAIMGLVRPTHPVWIELGTPVDGLYLVERHVFSFVTSQESDLGLVAFDY